MLSEKEVKKLFAQARIRKSKAKSHGSDLTYRVACRAERLLKKILEIKDIKKDKRKK